MKYIVVILVLAAIAFLFYWAKASEESKEYVRTNVEGVVKGVVHSGKDVGRNTSKAFQNVDFGGRR